MATKRPSKSAVPPAITPSVSPETGIELIQKLIEKASALRDKPELQSSDEQAWINLARDYLTRIFGSNSHNVTSVIRASGDGGIYMGMSDQDWQKYRRSGFENKIKLLNSCTEQLETDISLKVAPAPPYDPIEPVDSFPTNSKVFVVHGHNHGVKEAVARFLEPVMNYRPVARADEA